MANAVPDSIKMFPDQPASMSSADFSRLSSFIYSHCGIKMPDVKKTMLEARLQKRLRAKGLRSYREYIDLLFSSDAYTDELVQMIDAVTTNKTEFFRESAHFTYLTETILPTVLQRGGLAAPYTIWSSACSTGEEPYTLAIVLSEFTRQHPGFRYSILATDISTKVLSKAQQGIYTEDQTAIIPSALKQRYFLRSRDRSKKLVRVVPELRSQIAFERLNLMDRSYSLREESLDVIFCRNVIIYFDRETQQALLARLCRYIRSGGWLFLGHSETTHGFNLPLERVGSTIYRKI